MQRFKVLALMAAGLTLGGVTQLSATDWRDMNHDRQDLREDYRDLRVDRIQVNRLRADIARDQVRLNENIRFGRDRAAAQDARDLARDQRALDALLRDIRHDRVDTYRDRRDIQRDAYR